MADPLPAVAHPTSLAFVALWIALGAVAFTTALAVGLRGYAGLARRRRDRYRDAVADHLAAYAVDARDDPPPAPSGRLQQRVVREELVRLAPNLKGESRTRVDGLFRAYGLVEAAERDLEARDPLTAVRAAEALSVMRARDAASALAARLGHDDRAVRLACARALAELGDADAVPEIVAALSLDGGRPAELAEVLLGFGAAAEPFLRERLRDAPDAEQRRLAASTLGQIRARAALPELLAVLSEADNELVARAARALGRIGDASATAPLVALLDGERAWFVRVAAATALGALDDPAAGAALANALGAEEWEIRNAAARSLVGMRADGLRAVAAAAESIPAVGVGHYAGLLDVADRLGDVIAAAASGDHDLDRVVRAACVGGARVRLEELAATDGSVADYAARVLGEQERVAA